MKPFGGFAKGTKEGAVHKLQPVVSNILTKGHHHEAQRQHHLSLLLAVLPVSGPALPRLPLGHCRTELKQINLDNAGAERIEGFSKNRITHKEFLCLTFQL
jgi:hypothetical protein